MIRPSDVTNRPEWMLRGACRGLATAIWFPTEHERVAPAKAICAGCTVQSECLEYAIAGVEVHGVWGGTSEQERRRIRVNRRRAS